MNDDTPIRAALAEAAKDLKMAYLACVRLGDTAAGRVFYAANERARLALAATEPAEPPLPERWKGDTAPGQYKAQAGTWTLTAPDGNSWHEASPIKCLQAESKDRIPAKVALARIYDGLQEEAEQSRSASSLTESAAREPEPIDMVLPCPKCGMLHVDAPEPRPVFVGTEFEPVWTNPPHKSHLCHGCGHIWRPADVPTNGVAAVKTKGKNDSPAATEIRAAPSEPDWRDMATAPLDNTLVRLLVKFDDHGIEETEEPTATIGAHNDGEWSFVGWDWYRDTWTRGSGDLLGWLPMLGQGYIEAANWKRWCEESEVAALRPSAVLEAAPEPTEQGLCTLAAEQADAPMVNLRAVCAECRGRGYTEEEAPNGSAAIFACDTCAASRNAIEKRRALLAGLVRIHNDKRFKLGWIEQSIISEACVALTAGPAQLAVAPLTVKPAGWWNGIPDYDERDPGVPSISLTEDTWHDIPVYSEAQWERLTALRASTPSPSPTGEKP